METKSQTSTMNDLQINHQFLRSLVESSHTQVKVQQHQSEAQQEQILKNTQDVFWIFDLHSQQFIYISPAYEMIWGRIPQPQDSTEWFQAIHPDDRQRVETTFWQTFKQQTYNEEYRIIRPDGSIRWIRDRSLLFNRESENVIRVAGIAEDISDRKLTEEVWRAKEAKIRNEFIEIVSHEIRTPITAIRGSLGLLAAGIYDQKTPKGKEMLQIAVAQTDRLVRLINDVLDLGRLESGTMKLVMQSCNVLTLIKQSIDTIRSSTEQHQIQVSVADPAIKVWANPDAIIQTLTNLLGNAIKFSPPSTTVWLNVEPVNAPAVNPQILFKIKDQGRGIPVDKLETIFERFQQVEVSDYRQKGGTGLGLAICRQIIQQHGGRIWVESTLGKGSTFYFTLPAVCG